MKMESIILYKVRRDVKKDLTLIIIWNTITLNIITTKILDLEYSRFSIIIVYFGIIIEAQMEFHLIILIFLNKKILLNNKNVGKKNSYN